MSVIEGPRNGDYSVSSTTLEYNRLREKQQSIFPEEVMYRGVLKRENGDSAAWRACAASPWAGRCLSAGK